ncbi:C-C chemokine receptor type 6 [Talpa occidentalis]|uniref:C-C chemokine receptor type 6 n=1 Tax=Talpa occidentalis TaxID=50954 RepID=UPI00188F7365|nr:C-C chemokine receptor type 6 [Talpa occidentalis]
MAARTQLRDPLLATLCAQLPESTWACSISRTSLPRGLRQGSGAEAARAAWSFLKWTFAEPSPRSPDATLLRKEPDQLCSPGASELGVLTSLLSCERCAEPRADILPWTPGRAHCRNRTMSEEQTNSSFGYWDSFDYGELDAEDSPCSLQEVRRFSALFLPAAYALMCVCGLVGNMLVVLTFAFYKRSKSMTDVYLLNMAVADVLFVLTLPFWAVNHAMGRWVFNDAMCKLTKGVYAVNFNCGMLLLACISLDRFVAIVQAARSFRVRSRMLAYRRAICVAVWAVSVLTSSWTVVFYEKYKEHTGEVCEQHFPRVPEPVRWKLLALGLQLVFGLIPLAFMGVCYTLIVRTLVRAQNSRRHQAIRVIMAVVVVFLACQLPHSVVLLVKAARLGSMNRTCSSEKAGAYATAVTEALAFLHCCLNPVLYAFVGQKFRSYFLKVMKGLCCAWWGRRRPGLPCGRLQAEAFPSRQNSETAEHENVSSFTV